MLSARGPTQAATHSSGGLGLLGRCAAVSRSPSLFLAQISRQKRPVVVFPRTFFRDNRYQGVEAYREFGKW
jgi:hypothetical protein